MSVYQKVQDPIAFSISQAKAIASLMGCNEAQGQAVALTCLCENLTPIDFVRRYHLIQGKPTMRADAALAEFRMNFGGEYEIVERSPERAAIKLTRGTADFLAEYTWAEAQQSRWPWVDWKDHSKGLKDNWGTPTDQRNMLWVRLVSDSLRAFCPELMAGVYTPEEMHDVIEGELVSSHSTPVSASGFVQEVAEASPPVAVEAEGEAIDASFTVVDEVTSEPEDSHLAATVRSLFIEAFGDKSQEAMDATLQKREAKCLRNLSDDALAELRDKLTAKVAASNSGN